MILVYPDAPPGIEEAMNDERGGMNWEPSIVRGLLELGAVDSRQQTAYGAEFLDVGGRKVMDLKTGANDVRGLAPGVYFVREAQAQAQAAGSKLQAIRRVVLVR